MVSCSNSKKMNNSKEAENEVSEEKTVAGPPVIIYKTNDDYFDKVPVTLSEDKSEIVSYPGIKDVFYKGEFAYPTKLSNGFLLDNRGIGGNTAFLNITYEDYSKMEKAPSKEFLYGNILDKDPFTEMYNCGIKYEYKNIVDELNEAIESNKLDTFKKIK
jgi:hypothetical protein